MKPCAGLVITAGLLGALVSAPPNASADMPPDVTFGAEIHFSTMAAHAVLYPNGSAIAPSKAALGFSVMPSEEFIYELPRLSVALSDKKRSDSEEAGSRKTRGSSRARRAENAISVKLPAKVSGYLLIPGIVYDAAAEKTRVPVVDENPVPDSGQVANDEQAHSKPGVVWSPSLENSPEADFRRRSNLRRRMRQRKSRWKIPEPATRLAAVAKTLSDQGGIELCTDVFTTDFHSKRFIRSDSAAGGMAVSPYELHLIVSTRTAACVIVDRELVSSFAETGLPTISREYDLNIVYLTPDKARLLETSPHYICTGLYTSTGGAVGGAIADTYVSYDPAVGPEQLRTLCRDFYMTEPLTKEFLARGRDLAERPKVIRIHQVFEDD